MFLVIFNNIKRISSIKHISLSNVFRRQTYFVIKRISLFFENELHRTINDFEICYLFSSRQLFSNRIDNDVIVKFSRRR